MAKTPVLKFASCRLFKLCPCSCVCSCVCSPAQFPPFMSAQAQYTHTHTQNTPLCHSEQANLFLCKSLSASPFPSLPPWEGVSKTPFEVLQLYQGAAVGELSFACFLPSTWAQLWLAGQLAGQPSATLQKREEVAGARSVGSQLGRRGVP